MIGLTVPAVAGDPQTLDSAARALDELAASVADRGRRCSGVGSSLAWTGEAWRRHQQMLAAVAGVLPPLAGLVTEMAAACRDLADAMWDARSEIRRARRIEPPPPSFDAHPWESADDPVEAARRSRIQQTHHAEIDALQRRVDRAAVTLDEARLRFVHRMEEISAAVPGVASAIASHPMSGGISLVDGAIEGFESVIVLRNTGVLFHARHDLRRIERLRPNWRTFRAQGMTKTAARAAATRIRVEMWRPVRSTAVGRARAAEHAWRTRQITPGVRRIATRITVGAPRAAASLRLGGTVLGVAGTGLAIADGFDDWRRGDHAGVASNAASVIGGAMMLGGPVVATVGAVFVVGSLAYEYREEIGSLLRGGASWVGDRASAALEAGGDMMDGVGEFFGSLFGGDR